MPSLLSQLEGKAKPLSEKSSDFFFLLFSPRLCKQNGGWRWYLFQNCAFEIMIYCLILLLCKVSLSPKKITCGREMQDHKCLQDQGLSLFFSLKRCHYIVCY